MHVKAFSQKCNIEKPHPYKDFIVKKYLKDPVHELLKLGKFLWYFQF